MMYGRKELEPLAMPMAAWLAWLESASSMWSAMSIPATAPVRLQELLQINGRLTAERPRRVDDPAGRIPCRRCCRRSPNSRERRSAPTGGAETLLELTGYLASSGPPFRWTGAHPMLVKDEIRALSP